MEIDIFSNLSNYSKQFRISKSNLREMILEKQGKKKQLFAYTILNLNNKFVDDVVNNKKMMQLTGIEYFTPNTAEDAFGYRKNDFNKWKTKERKDLLNCLINTPVCFTKNIEAWLLMMENTQSMFSIAKEYKTAEEICSHCSLKEQCKRSKD